MISHFKYLDCTLLFSLSPDGTKNVHVMDGERVTESNVFEHFRDYYVAPRYSPNSGRENRKNCTNGKNIAVYQNTYLVYLTKSFKLVMYNLAVLYATRFRKPEKLPTSAYLIEFDLGKVRPQAFTFEKKIIKKDRLIVLLENGMIMKFYFDEKLPSRTITLPDSLKKNVLVTDIFHADSTTIVAANDLSSLTNVFVCLDKKLEVAHRLTVPNQGTRSSPSLARPPAQVHLPSEEKTRVGHQLPGIGDSPGEERPPAVRFGGVVLDD